MSVSVVESCSNDDEPEVLPYCIRFLTEVRHLAMSPLIDLPTRGEMSDRVVWSNDVFVHAEGMVELLRTVAPEGSM